MQVKDCNIRDDFSTALKIDNVFDVAGKFTNAKSLIILDDEKPVGILTPMDLVKRVLMKKKNPEKTLAGEIMSSPVVTVKLDDDLKIASDIMTKNNFMTLPVVNEKNKFVGVLTIYDVMMKVKEKR